jgi:hypothetical protein
VLVTREFNPDEPGISQLKYYAPGIGNVRVGWLGKKDTDREVLKLSALRQLNRTELAYVRGAALTLEAHAYQVRKAVYGATPPAERLPGG